MYQVSGAKLKQIRKIANKTQGDIAKIIGKNKADIAHYEHRRATPPADALITLMIALDLKASDIAEVKPPVTESV
jgi:transcriptional regulator with XRE-family HTH domain